MTMVDKEINEELKGKGTKYMTLDKDYKGKWKWKTQSRRFLVVPVPSAVFKLDSPKTVI